VELLGCGAEGGEREGREKGEEDDLNKKKVTEESLFSSPLFFFFCAMNAQWNVMEREIARYRRRRREREKGTRRKGSSSISSPFFFLLSSFVFSVIIAHLHANSQAL
jgi:hypothetical protein